MLILNQRQTDLLAWVNREGYVAVEKMAAHFQVTHQTIRRDITLLADNQLLQRYHGGASVLSSVENVAYDRLEVSSPGLDRPLTKAADRATSRPPGAMRRSRAMSPPRWSRTNSTCPSFRASRSTTVAFRRCP